jgi:predicted dienelactone hydrolase
MLNTPVPPPPQSSATSPTSKHLKAFIFAFFRRMKGVLEAQALPHVAHKTCEVYFGEADKTHQTKCRRLLQTRLELNPNQLLRFFHTSMGDTLLAWFQQFFHLPNPTHDDKKTALKDLLVQMAADPEGLSLLSFLRRFPNAIQVNLDQFLLIAKRVEWLLNATEVTLTQVQELSAAEHTTPPQDFTQLPDLRQFGSYGVQFSQFDLSWEPQSVEFPAVPRVVKVLCYSPEPWPDFPIPVIVQSHGLASNPEELEVYARHLASYGYFVAAPQHPGSDVQQIRRLLAGEASEVFKLSEFIDRPLDITALLDELERRNGRSLPGRLNLQQVGIMGYSFGAYTGFALAGAEIHFDKLELACGTERPEPNLSLLLQCQALGLPRQVYNLRDSRIQALLSLDSVGSEVFGPQGIAQISIPVLLMAGSHDTAAPLAFEQIRMFNWLTTSHHAIALMRGKSHIRDAQRLMNALDLQIKVSPKPTSFSTPISPFENYIKALSVAFFHTHLAQATSALPAIPPLSADYAAYLSQTPYDLWLISQASHSTLTQTLHSLDLNFVAELTEVGAALSNPEART